jgi:hypothetical protein
MLRKEDLHEGDLLTFYGEPVHNPFWTPQYKILRPTCVINETQVTDQIQSNPQSP